MSKFQFCSPHLPVSPLDSYTSNQRMKKGCVNMNIINYLPKADVRRSLLIMPFQNSGIKTQGSKLDLGVTWKWYLSQTKNRTKFTWKLCWVLYYCSKFQKKTWLKCEGLFRRSQYRPTLLDQPSWNVVWNSLVCIQMLNFDGRDILTGTRQHWTAIQNPTS
jgi:hypothetical protein